MTAEKDVIKYDDVPLAECGGEVQLSLIGLNKKNRYHVDARIYHMQNTTGGTPPKNFTEADDTTDLIVWYQGGTEQSFSPEESNKEVTLRKLILDQKVDVFVEKTGQERCNDQGSIWNGRTCLEDNQRLVFAYSEKKSFGNEPIRKCFDFSKGTPSIRECVLRKRFPLNILARVCDRKMAESMSMVSFILSWLAAESCA